MQNLRSLAVAAAALAIAACSDTPTAPVAVTPIGTLSATAITAARNGQTTTLASSVTGTVTNTAGAVGTFTGTEKITSFATNAAGNLVANVLVTGTAVVGGVATPISQTVSTLATTAGTCPVLALDLGAIHLDLLGLVVDLAAVHLDIVAQSGPGNLVGNLLCAVVHLLDGPGLGNGLTNLITLLNGLLA